MLSYPSGGTKTRQERKTLARHLGLYRENTIAIESEARASLNTAI